MPLYEYQCDACGQRFEVIQKFSETVEACRKCGKGPVHRLLSSPAIQFKGTGWYVTDYAQKGKSDGSSSSDTKSSAPAATTSSGDAASTDAKSDKKSDTPAAPASSTSAPAKSDS